MPDKIMKFIILLLILTFPVPTAADDAEWMLFGREGTCVPIAAAAERMEILRDITHPDQLVERLQEKGEEVQVEQIVPDVNSPRIISAPGLNLSLIFAPRTACKDFDDGPD